MQHNSHHRISRANRTSIVAICALLVLVLLVAILLKQDSRTDSSRRNLVLFCAAGMRLPIEQIRQNFERECGIKVEVQYGGSNTLLSQLQVSRAADLYLAADDSYLEIARQKKLVNETITIATMMPVVVVKKGNPRNIRSLADLIQPGVRVALGNPEQAAIGKKTKQALLKSGHWEALQRHVTQSGVFKPTVPDVANTVQIGSVDAGIVWSATAAQLSALEIIPLPELTAGASLITVGITSWSEPARDALLFARYIAGANRGLITFGEMGYEPVDGDPWVARPELTFFAGSVNRRALEPVIKRFEAREGVRLNTVYNGCGILTAQMRTIRDSTDPGFPDVYMACDVYYLDTVAELFGAGTRISQTDIVIAVAKGNPKGIETLEDLTKPGVRLAIGQPDQCTIGVLTRRLLETSGFYEKLLDENVVTQTASSAMLVPAVTTGAADVALVYRTDTLAEDDRIDVVSIPSPAAKAIQPFAVSRQTPYKHIAARLFETILDARHDFENAGFQWRPDQPEQSEEAPQ
jgi:molybdate transport system substrate-binding protein